MPPKLNCTNSNHELEPNPDVSGIGVLCGFFMTACIVFIFSIIKSILDHLISVYEEPSSQLSRWSLALRNTIISFADQQIVTGISVIIAGTFQIYKGITVYHWEFVVNLAWLSAVTHLFTLTALRDDIHNRRIRGITTWIRILGMGILLVLLIFAMFPMGHIMVGFKLPAGFPTWCLFHPKADWDFGEYEANKDEMHFYNADNRHPYNRLYVTSSYIALVYSFTTRVFFLQKGRCNFHPPHFLAHVPNPIKILESWMIRLKRSNKQSVFRKAAYKLLRTNFALLVCSVDLYQSTLWEMTWISAALAWGTIRIFLTRRGADFRSYIKQDTLNVWNFGQVVPVVLIALPVISFIETLATSPRIPPTPHLTPRRPLSKTLSYLNPFRLQNFNAHVSHMSSPRSKLYQKRWYRKLLILQYLLSLALIGDILFQFPGAGVIAVIDQQTGFVLYLIYYLLYILFDALVLFVSTLIFLDKDLQRFAPFSLRQGSLVSFGVWTVCILALLSLCLSWVILVLNIDYLPDQWSLI